jgi:hypothetical protein
MSRLGFALWAAGEGSVRTVDGRWLHGEVRFNAVGHLLVQPVAGESAVLELTNMAQATFAPGPFRSAGSLLPNGWLLQDIGEARGMIRLDGDVFNLRVAGRVTNITACHFAQRPMASDGEISARVDAVEGTGVSLAGVMMRSTSSSSIFAAVSCGRDGQLRFHRRFSEDRTALRVSPGPRVELPVWLRLQKRDQEVVASYSPDGRLWQRVGSDSTKWVLERTWREHQGELPLLRGSIGIFGASYGKDSVCTARVSQVALSLDGLLGEYFAGKEFESPRIARIDPQINFNWRTAAPDSSLPKADFSVRWTGKLLPPRSGEHRFYIEAEGAARLWIAGQEVDAASSRKADGASLRAVAMTLGTPVDLKLEFQPGTDGAAVRLGWFSGQQREAEVIPMTNFLSRFTATNAPERVAMSRATNDMPIVRGVILRDGTFLAGQVTFGDESAIRLSFAGRKDVPILNSKVARIIFRPQQLPFEADQGRSGLFLKGGDFFEGDFRRIEHGSVSVSSVLFGLKRFRIEGGEPVALVLNESVPAATAFRIRLLDGSSFCATSLSGNAEAVTIQEPLLGVLSIPVSDLIEIERIPPAVSMSAPR